MPSLTTQVPNLQEMGPVVEIKLAVGLKLEDILRQKGQNLPEPVQVRAMIDTGATVSVVREDIIKQLNLNPVGTELISTPSSSNVQCYKYLMRILFPNKVIINDIMVISTSLKGQDIQCLIGRDILKLGVLIYIGYTNTFTLSF
jgi:predicted aspartyl protease